jgi:ankyrin repeat protein
MKPVALLLFLTAFLSCGWVRPCATLAQTKSGPFRDDLMPPLMRAAGDGRIDEVRKLLQSGADANEKLDGLGITALMVAAGRGDLEIVKLLLKAGANPNAAGGVAHVGFFTPLTLAMNPANKNRLEVIDTLKQLSGKVDGAENTIS